ncbi:actin-like ATPase domain-containing protein [Neoconidiobolus thromboides FSU 785]|nr:actin-like ATPase domain-containing protein [Neoconidiobolus thromboides FSU 785]
MVETIEERLKLSPINIEDIEEENDIEIYTSTDYTKKYANREQSIVFDLGSQNCRVGWSGEEKPRYNFDSLVSKYKERANKGGIAGKSQLNVGNTVHSTLLSKANIRSPFDLDIINSIEHVESIMDYSFLNLGIDTESINHNIVFTEPAGNLIYSRNMVTELIFECYQAPSLTYGIDSLFSYYQNNNSSLNNDGLVISLGHHSTNVIPIYDGRARVDQATKISYGGNSATDYMLKSMQLKYPTFPVKMSNGQARYLMENCTFVASDYLKTLSKLSAINDLEFFNAVDVTVQFPYTEPTAEEKSHEELERIALRRKEQSERLREHIAKKKREKVIQREQELESLLELKASKKVTTKSSFLKLLEDYDLNNENELEIAIKNAEKALQRAQEKAMGIEVVEEKVIPEFTLVDIPDDELSEDSKREKKKQRLLKAGFEARERMRKAKQEAEEQKAELARQDEEYRLKDFKGWLSNLRMKHDELNDKIQSKKKIKNQLNDRRSQASQQRMKSIAMLAREDKKNNSKRNRNKNGIDDDGFGADDNDWNVYREIKNDEDSEEEEDANLLADYEAQLLEFDPTFQTELEARNESHGFNPKNSFLHRFQFGTKFNSWEDMDDIKYHHQLHVNIERFKIPEVLFQPSILGIDQAGLEQTLQAMFQRVGKEKQQGLIKNVLLTGGFSKLSNLNERIELLLTKLSPSGSKIKVKLAEDPSLDAWKGAANFVKNGGLKLTNNSILTIEQYSEVGHDYLIDHGLGNWV